MVRFRKLRDGSWGLSSDTSLAPGQQVTITTRAGQTRSETVGAPQGQDSYGFLYSIAPRAETAPAATPAATVGNLDGILTLFRRAAEHLRFPAIVLGVPGLNPTGFGAIRISVAGPRARFPGSLTVTTAERQGDGQRAWVGRVTTEGQFQPGRYVPTHSLPAITERLQAFAANPAEVGGQDGRLHGRCSFCRHALNDPRSTAVGYGPICADHFGLPWGERDAPFAAPTVRRDVFERLTTPPPVSEELRPATPAEIAAHLATAPAPAAPAALPAFDGTADYETIARREARREAADHGRAGGQTTRLTVSYGGTVIGRIDPDIAATVR